MSISPPPKPDRPKRTADDALPAVVAPSAAFILQLFLIPMIIVMTVVMVWLMFSWLAHMGSNPRELVADLKTLNDASWQKANTLSNMLRNSENAYLKHDAELAGELAEVLDDQLQKGETDKKRIWLRVFLCRALGEFHVQEGVPALLTAATQYNDPAEMDVRYAALEALAVLARNTDQPLDADPRLMEQLLSVSREHGGGKDERRFAELRSTAAFTLGVVGGDEGLERLRHMLDDAYPNARYNAATGLAKHGDPAAQEVLLEMLDRNNEQVVQGEDSDSLRQRKRALVLMNGIRATQRLVESADSKAFIEQLEPLRTALQALVDADLPDAITLKAQDSLKSWPSDSSQPAPPPTPQAAD